MNELEALEFDPTGQSTANRVPVSFNVSPPSSITATYFTIPGNSPFFTADAVLTLTDNNGQTRELIYGDDFLWAFKFFEGSLSTTKDLWAGISFIDRTIEGSCTLEANWLGGDWIVSDSHVAQILANTVENPRVVSWDSVANLPYKFPGLPAMPDVNTLYGMNDVVTQLSIIAQVIAAQNPDAGNGSGGGVGGEHILNTNNPHGTTKEHVQLGLVQNLGLSILTDVETETPGNSSYMTPFMTLKSIQFNVPDMISSALDSFKTNLTKSDVNLNQTPNLPASTAASLENPDNSSLMTPYTTQLLIEENLVSVNDAITAIGDRTISDMGGYTTNEVDSAVSDAVTGLTELINNHVNQTGNVHNLTLNDLNIGWLSGLSLATSGDIDEGAINKIVTADLLKAKLDNLEVTGGGGVTTEELNAHINATNPHNMIAADLDAYTKAETNQNIDAAVDNLGDSINNMLVNYATTDDVNLMMNTLISTLNESAWVVSGKAPFELLPLPGDPAHSTSQIVDVSSGTNNAFVLYIDLNGEYFLRSWDGSAWSGVTLPDVSGASINSVDVLNPYIAITTDSNDIYVSVDMGSTWTITQNVPGIILGVDYYPGGYWVVHTNSSIFITDDNFATLNITTDPTVVGDLVAVEVADTFMVAISTDTAVISTDMGDTWVQTTIGMDAPLRSLTMYSDNTIMATNDAGDVRYFDTELGDWVEVTNLPANSNIYTNNDGLFIAYEGSNVYKSYDKGDIWTSASENINGNVKGVKYGAHGWVLYTDSNSILRSD